ncbi:hypothetical protein HK096_003991 [Nowakowskiella sp. JEL0078]|nr:hypothetical protein HK096_003991 [Nowakowskiella sp. JEL0078]
MQQYLLLLVITPFLISATPSGNPDVLHARDLVTSLISGEEEMYRRTQPDNLWRRATSDSCSSSSNGPPSGLPSIFPTATGTRSCSAPISVTGVFDGGLQRYDRGAGYRADNNCLDIEPGSADTIFLLNDGATLQNVIIGQEVKDSVYCLGSCTLTNVWFERTCEDSWSLKNPTSCTSCVMSWTGGAISGFTDKVK